MMKSQSLAVRDNREVKKGIWKLTLDCPDTEGLKPGQFAQIKVPGYYLARPISLNSIGEGTISFVYRIAGKGTLSLTEIQTGSLEVITGCGNGFADTEEKNVLVIGGGIGCAPLLPLITRLVQTGHDVKVIFGFKNRDETLFEKELSESGAEYGFCYDEDQENPVMKMKEYGWENRYFYTCGPAVMMKAVCEASEASGQCSLEARMGCGFGACMGCSAMFKDGMKRICKEGPVFGKEEILWQNLK